MLDNRLWMRLGRQTIVWGKTELFRSQDQFNPQDLGLSSLQGETAQERSALALLSSITQECHASTVWANGHV